MEPPGDCRCPRGASRGDRSPLLVSTEAGLPSPRSGLWSQPAVGDVDPVTPEQKPQAGVRAAGLKRADAAGRQLQTGCLWRPNAGAGQGGCLDGRGWREGQLKAPKSPGIYQKRAYK